MEYHHKKLLTIVCEAVLEERLSRDVRRLGAHGHTVTDARGGGLHGSKHGTWSFDRNIRVEVICDDAVADAIASHVAERYARDYGLVLYVSDVGVMRPERF
ncbi:MULTISPECIES: P-II family nitrogen regulator [Crenobacter]|uniref:Transcriptional regulator n=2 Tax=Crenobacter TaxID=1654931 RepID=A0A4T0V4L0_9NEIS|nr:MULTISPECIES: transcriptional regulator [Crenobacter]NDV11423.1 transcriptional regulator [Crenobacter caeni]TIC86185.1 transcriptional regulator [Crenobacter intestini]